MMIKISIKIQSFLISHMNHYINWQIYLKYNFSTSKKYTLKILIILFSYLTESQHKKPSDPNYAHYQALEQFFLTKNHK